MSPVVHNLFYLRAGAEILHPAKPVRLLDPYGPIFAFAGGRIDVPRDDEAAAIAQIGVQVSDRFADLSREKISGVQDIAGANSRNSIHQIRLAFKAVELDHRKPRLVPRDRIDE